MIKTERLEINPDLRTVEIKQSITVDDFIYELNTAIKGVKVGNFIILANKPVKTMKEE